MNFHDVYEESKQVYIKRTVSSQKAYKEAKRYLPGGDTKTTCFLKPYPLFIVRAYGPNLFDP